METAYQDDARELRVGHLPPPYRFDSPFRGAEFCLLLVVATEAEPGERTAVVADLLSQGCRSVVCVGQGCQAWAAAFDEGHARLRAALPPRAVASVSATSHPEDLVDEVSSHFATLSHFDDFVPRRFLLLVLGGDDLCLARYRRAIVAELRRG